MEIRTRQKRRYPSALNPPEGFVIVQTFIDRPADDETWDENALVIAAEMKIPLDEAHRLLCRYAPHIYERRTVR